jgi:hypothetical protein
MTKGEAAHLERVKNLECAVCAKYAPSHAHHLMHDRASGRKPGHYCTIPLCDNCHVGPNGIHGDRSMWKVYKISEMEALDQTLAKLYP